MVIGSYFAIKTRQCRQKTYPHWAAACLLIAFTLIIRVSDYLFGTTDIVNLAAYILALLGCHQFFAGLSFLHSHRDYGLNKYIIPLTVGSIVLTCGCYFLSTLAESACVCFAALILLLGGGGLACERVKNKAHPSMLRRLISFAAFTLFFHGLVTIADSIGGGSQDTYLLYQSSLILMSVATCLLAYTLPFYPVENDGSDDKKSSENSVRPSPHHYHRAAPIAVE
ncbi:hypothetical protein GTH32_14415 [Alteromonas sp. 345S023]|uniref:Uncharacterized protein n=1 Tax=Alteromonas profundi TaxID=2696062 RepID=A0A7X5RM45_9ALTE|nr:hypothetical protein [Alteromonas profundi]NDV92371.1 hypothetical protein [Alteromonas profundi]